MKNMFRLIVLILLLGGWTLAALSLHVIRGEGSRIVVIPKKSLDYHEIYVDTRKWTMDDVGRHPALVSRLIQNGKADLLQHVAPEKKGDALQNELQVAMQH